MFGYNLELALRGLRRFPKSTVLVTLTVAFGLAACMTALVVLHVLSADPLPGRSDHLYLAWVDTVQAKVSNAGNLSMAMNGIISDPHPYFRITQGDAQALLNARRAAGQAVVADMVSNISTVDGKHQQGSQVVLATSSQFVSMFGVALRYGRNWSAAEEKARAPVVIIDTELATKLFGEADAVGRVLHLGKAPFRVIGVYQPYAPQPHFFGLDAFAFNGSGGENLMLPYTSALEAGLQPLNSGTCDANAKGAPGPGVSSDPAHCASLGFWVQLGTPAKVAAYNDYLRGYVEQQKLLAGFPHPAAFRLIGVPQWLTMKNVVPSTARLNVWLAMSFLLLCMFNVAGLLAARFLYRSAEIGVRRALGASRASVFVQHVLEASAVCMLGGLLALPLTLLALWVMRRQGQDFSGLVRLDPVMFAGLFALALLVGLVVALIPAWRASAVEPGLQVKAD